MDPTSQEEVAAVGSLTVIATPQGEICGAYKTNGAAPTTAQVLRCVRVAASAAQDAVAAIQRALASHDVQRVAARVRRRIPGDLAEQPVASQLGALDLGAAPVRSKQVPAGPAPEPPTQAVRRPRRSGDVARSLPVHPPGDDHALEGAMEGALLNGDGLGCAPGGTVPQEDAAVDWRAAAVKSKGASLEEVFASANGNLAGSVKRRRPR